jgi:hypothetical protein
MMPKTEAIDKTKWMSWGVATCALCILSAPCQFPENSYCKCALVFVQSVQYSSAALCINNIFWISCVKYLKGKHDGQNV